MSTRIVPISDLRRRAKEVIDTVQHQQDAVYVTQHGRPVAVLVDYGQYEQLLEQLEELTDQLREREKVKVQETALREQPQPYSAGGQTATDLNLALSLVQQLSSLEKTQVVGQIIPDLARALQGTSSTPRKSLRGLWRGQDITEQDIAEARREMWGSFPREDI